VAEPEGAERLVEAAAHAAAFLVHQQRAYEHAAGGHGAARRALEP
jgi:hypothetical protein